MPSDMFKTLSVIRGSTRYNAWLYSRVKKHLHGVVLDIGSGLGDIAQLFQEPGIQEVICSDYDTLMLDALRERTLPLRKYSILPLDITKPVSLTMPGGIADTITCINVLEHIEEDVTALEHMKHFLKKDGRIIIFVPALQGIYGTLDKLVDHHRRYTKKTLRLTLQKAGFKINKSYYMNIFGIITWFLAGRIFKQKEFHQQACHLLDKIVPTLRAFESIANPPLGQSLIVIAEIKKT